MFEFLYFIISLILIYTSILGYGLIFRGQNKEYDIFLTFISGYFFVGLITIFLHFFFPIGDFISIAIMAGGLTFVYIKKNQLKYFFSIRIISTILFISIILIGFSEHPIDANMYHHPYISYIKSEKIIFGIANIEFRFGHISFLQYVQAAILNSFLNIYSIASPNLIIYSVFIIYISELILKKNSKKLTFILSIIISTFVLVKLARYREFGNDLIPLVAASYFLIIIIDNIYYKSKNSNLFFFSPIYATFMLTHKISYIFSSLIFLTVFKKKYLLEINKHKLIIFLFFITTVLWLTKNIITTSCFIYPITQTCLSNTEWYLQGIADPKQASWLTELWAKDFITNPDWEKLNLDNYINSFAWVSNWLNNHFIKILEKISPILLVFLLIFIFINFNNKKTSERNSIKNINFLYYLLGLIFVGLFIWFIKAPLFRYGSFYIISFISIIFILITFNSIDKTNQIRLSKLKYIFFISLIFFLLKNINRQINSEYTFFPFTKPNIKNYEITHKDPLLLRPSSNLSVCYYTKNLCSHETPGDLKISKIYNYYLFK